MNTSLFTGGPIITMDPARPNPQALAIRDGKILSVGTLDEVRHAAGGEVQTIDLAGNTLLPGFIDAHSHPLWASKTRGAPVVDVRAITVPTYQALLAKIRRRVAVAEPCEHLLFFGLDAQLHPDMEPPTRALLDEIAPNHPVGIQTSNCHAVFLNSRAFEACGIDENTPTPTGSHIERDANGRPSGKIEEAYVWVVLEVFYKAWGQQRLSAEFEASIHQFIRQGITTTTEHLYVPHYKASFMAALEQGLPLPRIAAYHQAVTPDMRIDRLNVGDDRLWSAGVKIHADGSPFIGNIWLTQPYLSTPITLERMRLQPGHTGGPNYPSEYFEQMVRNYVAQGWRMSVHTQGDRTIDMVLDLVEQVLGRSAASDHRFRLEHCGLMRPDQIDRAIELGVLCSFFVNHITHWGVPIEDALFGPERAATYMPAGTAARKGMRISLHADSPMTDPSALELMRAAMTRIAGDGRCVGPEERLDAWSALKAVTIDAAFQIGMEDKLGSLSPGKHADLVVLARNPLETPADALAQISIRSTWLAGKPVWQA